MIDIKRLSPKILASAAFATFALGVGAVVVTDMLVDSCRAKEQSAKVTFTSTEPMSEFEFHLKEIAVNGAPECLCLAKNLSIEKQEGKLTAADGETLVDCYVENDDDESAELAARLMSQAFPQSADLLTIVGSYDLEAGDYPSAQRNLNEALLLGTRHGMSRRHAAMANNNYAWVALHAPHPDLNVVRYHAEQASRLASDDCAILHTRLTYEFANVLDQGADQRNLESWVNVREPYVQCLMAFQSPRFRQPGNIFVHDSISSQVFSNYVMDGLLLQDLDVDANAAQYLAPTRAAIAEKGPERFCYDSMGIADPYVQGACLRTIRQAQFYWDNGIR